MLLFKKQVTAFFLFRKVLTSHYGKIELLTKLYRNGKLNLKFNFVS